MDNEKSKDGLDFKESNTPFYSESGGEGFVTPPTPPTPPTENKSLIDKIKDIVNNTVLGIAVAVTVTLALFPLWQMFISIPIASRLGDMKLVAVSNACSMFFHSVLLVIVISAVWFCIFPLLFRKKEVVRFVVGIISVVIMGIVGYIAHRSAVIGYALPEEIVKSSLALSAGIGAAFPILFGSLALLSHGRPLTKAVLLQLGLGAVFYVLAAVIGTYTVTSMNMACMGISAANLISSIIVFAVAVFTGKDFRSLVSRKK